MHSAQSDPWELIRPYTPEVVTHVFEAHKARKVVRQFQRQLAHWQALHDAGYQALQLAMSYHGVSFPEFMCKPGETVFARLLTTDLIEYRAGPRTYQGTSRGVSVPILPGVRYRTGRTRGMSVQGALEPTNIDTGTVYVTNMRFVFRGQKQTRDLSLEKILSIERDNGAGTVTVYVSNRQSPTTFYYGPKVATWFTLRMDLAVAHHRGTLR